MNEDMITLITQLVRLTQEKKLNWNSTATFLPQLPENTSLTGEVYMTKTGNKDEFYRIYKTKLIFILNGSLNEVEKYCLEILDDSGNAIFEFPFNSAVADLYKAIHPNSDQMIDFKKLKENLLAQLSK